MKCKLHPKYKGISKPISKKENCNCKEVYNFIKRQQRFKLEIATEKIIIDKTCSGNPWSSRVLADEIVAMILDTIEGKRPEPIGDELKPWLKFGIKCQT